MGVGKLAQESNGQVVRNASYDYLSRQNRLDTGLEGKNYSEEWTFDAFGRPFQHFFEMFGVPKTGEQTAYQNGYPHQVRSAYPLRSGIYPVYRELQRMNARGQVEKERVAAGAEYVQEREFDTNTGRVKRLLAQSPAAGFLQDVHYNYDWVGNVTSRVDSNGPLTLTESFGYDGLQRLLTSTVSAGGQTITYSAADQAIEIADLGSRVRFGYGPNRERLQRVDYAGGASVVHFVGGAEVRYAATASEGAGTLMEVRRYIGNVLSIQRGSGATYSLKRQVLLTDRQGSTHLVLGAMTLRPVNEASPMSFDVWGRRRDGLSWGDPVPWTQGLETLLKASTTHGYTGHEMVESVGVIHMNGRLYDQQLARFLQADPFVQSPGNGQNWNRYSYAFNNPLTYTDPSGYMSTGDWIRTIAAVAISVVSYGTATGASWGLLGGASLSTGQSVAVMAVGGFAAGAVQTGSLRGAVSGAVSSAVFFGIGRAFSQASWAYNANGTMKFSGYAALTLSRGAAGGVMETLQGGRFGHGFAAAGVSSALSPMIDRIGNPVAGTIASAVVGGTASSLAGGKLANGAVTAAFSYAFGRAAGGGGAKEGMSNSEEGSLPRGSSRELTIGEFSAGQGMYGDGIDWGRAAIWNKKYAFFQSSDITMSPDGGNIYAGSDVYMDDYSVSTWDMSYLVHELGHVWQVQNGYSLSIPPREYDYTRVLSQGGGGCR